jgi:hypothetical protein
MADTNGTQGEINMGEYAKYQGNEIKIGTCEDMYYLRYDQRRLVRHLPGNVDPNDPETACQLRFRFPWPDEDDCQEPGSDGPGHDYERSVHIRGALTPDSFEHYPIQFQSAAGYLLSIPCPESLEKDAQGNPMLNGYRVARNGHRGVVHLCQQKPAKDGVTLMAILKCGGCGAKWRAETWADAEPYVVALRAEGDRRHKDVWIEDENGVKQYEGEKFWHTIADRVTAGYPVGQLAKLLDEAEATNV